MGPMARRQGEGGGRARGESCRDDNPAKDWSPLLQGSSPCISMTPVQGTLHAKHCMIEVTCLPLLAPAGAQGIEL